MVADIGRGDAGGALDHVVVVITRPDKVSSISVPAKTTGR
jgi:hypothetical protein